MTAERVAELGGPTPGVPGAFVGGGPAITPSCAPVAAIEGGRARVAASRKATLAHRGRSVRLLGPARERVEVVVGSGTPK